MNTAFAESTTGIAFCLTLTKLQCNALLRIADQQAENPRDNYFAVGLTALRGLEARGLFEWERNSAGQAFAMKGLTEAGALVAQLLKQAGLSIQNTNTISVLKRLQNMGEAA